MMSLGRSALLVVACMLSFASSGWADTIAGTTTGCFTSSGNGNLTGGCGTGTATDAGLTFNMGTFSVSADDTGFAAIGDTSNSLGLVGLAASDIAKYTGDTFILGVMFTDPSSGSTGISAQLKGSVTALSGGGVQISFNNPTDILLSNGQTITLDVNNLGVRPGGFGAISGDAQISGVTTATAVPEPASLLLLASGLVSIGGLRRRWFQ